VLVGEFIRTNTGAYESRHRHELPFSSWERDGEKVSTPVRLKVCHNSADFLNELTKSRSKIWLIRITN